MAYDEVLADRVRAILEERREVAEIKMFGGICFTLRGNMLVGVINDDLFVRVGKDAHAAALRLPGAREMDFTKRPMGNAVYASGPAIASEDGLRGWIDRALAFVDPLPPKAPKAPKKRPIPRA